MERERIARDLIRKELVGYITDNKMKEFREHFAIASQEPSRGAFGEGSGWIWGGFWQGFGRILDNF